MVKPTKGGCYVPGEIQRQCEHTLRDAYAPTSDDDDLKVLAIDFIKQSLKGLWLFFQVTDQLVEDVGAKPKYDPKTDHYWYC